MYPSSGELIVLNIWYMSLCIDDRFLCRFAWDSSKNYTPDGHLYTV